MKDMEYFIVQINILVAFEPAAMLSISVLP